MVTVGDASSDVAPTGSPYAVQPFGFLLAFALDRWVVTHVSANVEAWLGRTPAELMDRPIDAVLIPEAVHAIRSQLQAAIMGDGSGRIYGLTLDARGLRCDIALQVRGDAVLVECEGEAPDAAHASDALRGALARLRQVEGLEALLRTSARELRALSLFDRVMLYRLEPHADAVLVAESLRPGLDPLASHVLPVGMRQQLRAAKSPAPHLVADVAADAVPVVPGPSQAPAIDLAGSVLRSPSAGHAAHLRALGVAASMSVPMFDRGGIWGVWLFHHHEPQRLSLRKRDAIELLAGMLTALVEGSREEERRDAATGQPRRGRILIAELNHRIRNIFSLMHGIVSQSRLSAESVESFAAVLGKRIEALSRAHDQLTDAAEGPASFSALVAAEAGAYLQENPDRVRVEGPRAMISPRAFTSVALVLHEMITNSAKYGALSERSGCVRILTGFDARGNFSIDWRESGGPPVVKPDRRGFGSVMIERSIPADLGGEAEIAFLPEGVHARFLLPAECVSEAEPGEPAAAASQAAEGSAPMPGHVLLAEDNLIIALDTEEMLLGFGVQSVQVVSTVAAALAALDERRPDFALLDVNLGDAMSFAVAERLRALGIRFAFATGYSEPEALPESLRDVPQLRKPFSLDSLRRILASPA